MPDELEAFEERAAIIEHMAGHPRKEAECMACRTRSTIEHGILMLAEYVSFQRDPECRLLMRSLQDLLRRNGIRVQGLGEAAK